MEFLAHLVPHIQHRYECRLHTYGALSTSIRKRFGWVGRRPTIILAGEGRRVPGARSRRSRTAASDATRGSDAASDGAHSPTATNPGLSDPTPHRATSAVVPTHSTRDRNRDSHPDDEPDPFTQARKRRWAELIRHVWLDDPEICEQMWRAHAHRGGLHLTAR